MSLIITNTPEQFQPVIQDGLFFTVSADTTNEYFFRYVYKVYVNDSLIFTGKATPNPYGLGIIDLSRLLEDYTTNDPISLQNTTPIYTHQTFPFSFPYEEEVIKYNVLFGYEYSDSPTGNVSGFTGIGNIVGDPTVDSGYFKTFSSTMGVNGNATEQDFNVGKFILSGTPIGTDPTVSGLFLTNSPRYRDIQPSEYYTLSFTNYYLGSGSTYLSEPYYVEYKFYDDSGILITAVTLDNITVNGGGPRTDCNYVYQGTTLLYPSGDTTYNVLNVGAGPQNIPFFPSGTSQYTVQLFGGFTGSTSPIQPSPTPTPSPKESCVCYSYTATSTTDVIYVQYLNCEETQYFYIPVYPGDSETFCACLGTAQIVSGKGGTLTSVSGCTIPTPTPTPTPSVTPCNCNTVYLIYTGESASTSITYNDCATRQNATFNLPAFVGTNVCACGSFMVPADVYYEEVGSCNPIASATPTPTKTPSVTPTITPSPSTPTYTYLGRTTPDAIDGPTACSTYTTVRSYTGLKTLSTLTVGDFLYDTYPSSPTNGGGNWIALKVGGAGSGYAFQVDTNGEILDTYTC